MYNNLFLYINETFRTLPFILLIITLIISILFNNIFSLLLFILLIIDNILNKIFKNIFKYYVPINGDRPKNAKNCGCFIDINNINKLSTTYGMPSGHSQNIFFITTILSLYLNNIYKTIFLLFIAIYGGYLRIKFGCHTLNQVIIGGIIGIIFGYLCYKFIIIKFTNLLLLN